VLLRELRKEVVRSGSGLISLDDAWTLFAWSHWLKDRYERQNPPLEVAIIHVDDHRDMMSPRIAWDGTCWYDLLTGRSFTIFDPESVQAGILSGAIGVGSFFAPFVHELPSVLVRHLSLSAGWVEDSREWWLLRETNEDTIIRPGLLRPEIGMTLMGPNSPEHGDDRVAGRYRFTRTYERCFSDLPNCPILLHIDLDYFNNRYDRDSDWREKPGRHDPGEEEILAKVDELFAALNQFGVAQRIENITVALSPGFFPAEFWRSTVERVEQHLSPLGLDLGRGGNGKVICG